MPGLQRGRGGRGPLLSDSYVGRGHTELAREVPRLETASGTTDETTNGRGKQGDNDGVDQTVLFSMCSVRR